MNEWILWLGVAAVSGELALYAITKNPATARSALRWALVVAASVLYLLCSAAWNHEPTSLLLSICASLVVVLTAVLAVYNLFCWLNIFPRE